MASYVCSGATTKCTMGTAPSSLIVLPARTIFMSNQPMANVSDIKPMVNILPFGLCRSLANPAVAAATAANLGVLTPMPCVPNTVIPWMPGKRTVNSQMPTALLSTCKLQCAWAGTISLLNDGQNGLASEGASDIDDDEKHAELYHYKKIQSELRQGYALLADNVYYYDGSRKIEKGKNEGKVLKAYNVPGFQALNGQQLADLLNIPTPNLDDIKSAENEREIHKSAAKSQTQERNQLLQENRISYRNGQPIDTVKKDRVKTLKKSIKFHEKTASLAKKRANILIKAGDYDEYDLADLSGSLVSNINGKKIHLEDSLVIRIQKDGGILDNKSGFKAEIYKRNTYKFEKDKYIQGDPEYVLAFGGSDSFTEKHALITDWYKTNLFQGIGLNCTYPDQYKEAALLGMLLKQNGIDAVIVGHSLGGGLTSCACAASGLQGCSFNPAGLHLVALAHFIDQLTEKDGLYDKWYYKTVKAIPIIGSVIDGTCKSVRKLIKNIPIKQLTNKEIYNEIENRAENVVAYCSKTDILTNTQDDEVFAYNNVFNFGRLITVCMTKGMGMLFAFKKEQSKPIEFIKGILPKTYGNKVPIQTTSLTHIIATGLTNKMPRFLRKGIIKAVDKLEDIASVLIAKANDLSYESSNKPYLNYVSFGMNAAIGHSMDLLMDALVLDKEGINNSKKLTYQNDNIKRYINKLWAEEKESTDEITVLYKQLDKEKTEYGWIDKTQVERTDKNANPVFDSEFRRNDNGNKPFNIQYEYKGSTDYMKEKIENVIEHDEFES